MLSLFYTTARFGDATVGAIINGGFWSGSNRQTFNVPGTPCIDVRVRKASVYSSYFAQPMTGAINEMILQVFTRDGNTIELTNNYYDSGVHIHSAKPGYYRFGCFTKAAGQVILRI